MIWQQNPWSLCNKRLLRCPKMTVMFVTITCCSKPTWYIVQKLKQVLNMSIPDTNTSSQTLSLFTGASFIIDCLLQPMLHVNHPLLQFADIMDHLLSTAALFSRFYSHRIQTWAIKAASWFLRSHVHVIEIGSCNFQVSQGSVETFLKWGWKSSWCMCTKFRWESDS